MRVAGPDLPAVHTRAEVFARRMDRVLRQILDEAAGNIGATITSSAVTSSAGLVLVAAPPPPPGLPGPRGNGASPEDVAGIIPAWAAALQQKGLLGWLRREYAQQAYDQLVRLYRALGLDLRTLPSITILSELGSARDYLASARNRLVGVGDTLWHDARSTLVEGLSGGEGVPALSARLRTLAGLAGDRARVVARTEVIGAANAGSIDAMRASGVVASKEWIATADDRTRPDHAEADGQVVGLDEPFTVGDTQMDHPGDPDAPADEVVNCRCSLGYQTESETG